jgi:ISXO2-like transposase domain
VSATAGTIFDGTRTPLTVWFSAAWHLTSGKGGISATELQREMQLGSYQTAWAMLHRYRSVMVLPGRDRLTGDVEVDEAFLGGPEAGIPGRGALGKVLFAAAVELNSPKGLGRARLGIIKDASAESLQQFLLDNVEPGSTIVTDGWASYPKATRGHYTLKATSVSASGRPAHEALPGVHLVFSLVKRWVMGTLHGSISPEHMPAYFDEWVFRFNRRRSRSRGLLFQRLLQQAVEGDALTYKELRKAGRTRPPPPPPVRERMRPPSLERDQSGLPWRTHEP